MNILSINIFFVRYMVSEIPRVSVFEHFPLYNYMCGSVIQINTSSKHS